MTDEERAFVTHRLTRARETIAEARLLLSAGHTNACVNRLYYATFDHRRGPDDDHGAGLLAVGRR